MSPFVLPMLPLLRFLGLLRPERPFYQEWDFWVSMFTLLLASATLWVAYETRTMRKGSDKAMDEMKTHAAASANAAKAAADATKALVEIGQRPWISLNTISREWELLNARPLLSIGITLLNSGKTPALGMIARTDYYIAVDSFPENPEYLHPSPTAPAYCLAPGIERGMTRLFPLSADEAARLAQGQAVLYAYGDVQYSDVFGHRRTTQWCSQYDATRQKFVGGPHYNNID